MALMRYLMEFGELGREVIKDSVKDYINYKKAQITLWKYQHKDNFCTACGIVNKHELEAMLIILEHEEIQKNKRNMIARIKIQRRQLNDLASFRN